MDALKEKMIKLMSSQIRKNNFSIYIGRKLAKKISIPALPDCINKANIGLTVKFREKYVEKEISELKFGKEKITIK